MTNKICIKVLRINRIKHKGHNREYKFLSSNLKLSNSGNFISKLMFGYDMSEIRRIVGLCACDIMEYGEKSIKGIPIAFNRKRIRIKNKAMYELCIIQSIVGIGRYHIGDFIAYLDTRNLGTSKYPDIVKKVKFAHVSAITDKCVKDEYGNLIKQSNIIGVIKQ